MRRVSSRFGVTGVLGVMLGATLGLGACGGSPAEPPKSAQVAPAPAPTPEPTEAEAPRLSETAVAAVDALLDGLGKGGSSAPAPKPPATPASAPASTDRWLPGVNMAATLDQVLAGAQRTMTATGLSYEGENVALLGAFLTPGDIVQTRRQLLAGVRYAFVASSARRTPIGYVVRDPAGNAVKSVPTTTGEGTIDITPTVTGVYELSVVSFDHSEPTFVTLAALRDGGVIIPAERFRTSVHGTIERAGKVSQAVAERGMGSGIHFHAGRAWALYGMVMPPGGAMDITNIRFSSKHIVLSAGDADSRDINLSLTDASGRLVEEDTDPSAIGMVAYYAAAPSLLNLKVTCAKAAARSLVTALVLTIH